MRTTVQPPTVFAFGDLTKGRWAMNPGADTEAWGVCGRCGNARAAIELRLTRTPFKDASHDYWGCPSCR